MSAGHLTTVLEVSSDSAGPVRLVQVTDTHLNRRTGGELLGLNTDFSLNHVLDLVRAEHADNDIVLVTGDISDHGAADAYTRARRYFETLSGEKFWLPGNHDDLGNMRQATLGGAEMSKEVRVKNWQIVLLNTQIPGEVGGEIGERQLQWLQDCLQAGMDDSLNSLICLHHQPVKVGCKWLDQQMVSDAEQLFALLQGFTGVKGLLWGHVHQQMDSEYNGIKLMSTPSTCVQFAANSDDFKIDLVPPGYRWLELTGEGNIETGVSRVTGVEFPVDLNSTGYE